VEHRLAPLYRRNPTGGKRLSVAYAVNLVQDRDARVARPKEIGVQGMDRPLEASTVAYRSSGGDERLRCDLATEHPQAVLRRAEASVQVHF
jgi:hypothetical protein